jgi:hypothetical protein
MPVGRYRVKSSTLVLICEGDRHVARTVPAGAIITVNDDDFADDKFLEATWGSKLVQIFTQDLRSRGTRIKEKPVAANSKTEVV